MSSVEERGDRRVRRLVEDQRRLFREASRESVIVARALDVTARERLPEEFAWLFVATHLLEENRRLLQTAQAAIASSAVPAVLFKENL